VIRYKCWTCGVRLENSNDMAGREDRCPNCNALHSVPVSGGMDWRSLIGHACVAAVAIGVVVGYCFAIRYRGWEIALPAALVGVLIVLTAYIMRAWLCSDDCKYAIVAAVVIAVALGCYCGIQYWGWPWEYVALFAAMAVQTFLGVYIVGALTVGVAAGAGALAKTTKLDKRAKTAGKRLVKWLDKKFPADDD